MASRLHHMHQAFHLGSRESQPVPLEQLINIPITEPPSLVARGGSAASTISSAPTNICTPNDKDPQCQKDSQSNNITIPVVLGVVLPLTAAFIVFIFLHRRHVKKLRREDANDPHKSLDFGMDPATARTANKKKGKKGATNAPEMSAMDPNTEKQLRRGRGMSMDMGMGSPYLLPPGLENSRESLHSLSRTVHSGDDRYRPANTFIPNNDSASMHSYPATRRGADDSSSYAGSASTGRGYGQDRMDQDLLRNAQRMSRSMPPTQRTSASNGNNVPQIQVPEAFMQVPRKGVPSNPRSAGLAHAHDDPHDSYRSKDGADFRQSNNYLGSYIHSREPSSDMADKVSGQESQAPVAGSPSSFHQTVNRESPPPVVNSLPSNPRPPRKQSLGASTQPAYQGTFMDNGNDDGEGFKVTPPSPPPSSRLRQSENVHRDSMPEDYPLGGGDASGLGFDVRRLSMGVRPLPPDDPTDNPEQRANRIRSFYKEYFDDSKPGPMMAPGEYAEDYDETYLGDGAIFDPASGQFVMGKAPFAEPHPRRAMTPPPRMPPRFQGGSRHQSTQSGGRTPTGPRAFSSASGRFGPSGRGPPRPPLPLPGPLNILPSPHLLKEDSFLPIDFAPPSSYKDRQAGRPESPRGGHRPYSPMRPAHLPLVSSFDDLSVMPSPHSLRKSGTFTALDFAPPPRFKNSDTASDAGSIRSNGSAMSQQQLHSIRAGAYRVSRIPKEVVGTRDELQDSLKPSWTLR